MKRILYSIFALSTFLFTATSCEDKGTSTDNVIESVDDESVDPSHIRGYGDREAGGLPPAAPEADQMYGFQAEELSSQIVGDLGVDEEVATAMVKVYYDRNRQLSEMQRLLEVRGQARPDETELRRIDTETEERVRRILTPEQFRAYERNRAKYDQITAHKTAADEGESVNIDRTN